MNAGVLYNEERLYGSSTNSEATMSVVDFLFRPAKPPRTKHTCKYCNGNFGLARPNFPFCKAACKEAYNQAVILEPEPSETNQRFDVTSPPI
jgi:hypothetical protein